MLRPLLAGVTAGFTCAAWAGNGLNLIGYGAESVFMGGADVALARDTSALNTNPAGLAQTSTRLLDNFSGVAYGDDVRHRDGFGNDRRVDNKFAIVGNFGYAMRITGTNITVGLGLFAQGGAGNVYKNLNTAFGTNDELSSLFRIVRVSPGLAWKVSDRLGLGASLPINYADVRQKIFPATSVFNPGNPAASFFGYELKDAKTLKAGFKLGVQYYANDDLTLGAAYSHKTKLPLRDGTLTANMNAAGLGLVRYRDARVEGLALPHEVAMGFAYKLQPGILLSFKYAWLNWADAIRTSTLTASSPDNALAPPVLSSVAVNNWRDQHVFAMGAEFDIAARTKLRVGYNYGRQPVPLQNLSPLLAVIGEHHFTAGVARDLGGGWSLAFGMEYQRGAKAVYTNPALPFGPNAEERSNFPAFDLMLSKRW